MLPMKKGDWYNAKQVEDRVDTLSETAGLFGYAFADVQPDFQRDKDTLTMGIDFRIANAPRVYVERVERSAEHTSELQSLMRRSSAVFCFQKKKTKPNNQ